MKKGIVVTPEDFHGVDWCTKARALGLDTIGLHSGGGVNHQVLARLGMLGTEDFRQHCRALGMAYEYELHAAASLLDSELFEQHPEYFALDYLTDRRRKDFNWCISCSAVSELLSEGSADLTRMLPSATHRYYYWGADHPSACCHCAICSRYSFSELNLLSANVMLRGIRQTDSRGQLAYLAYIGGYDVPKQVQPEDGIFLEFAPYPRCYRHAIDDPGCDINRKYWNSLLRYGELFDLKQAHILEYWLDSSLFSRYAKPAVKPPCSAEVLERDIIAYCNLGITHITTFAVYMDGEYFACHGSVELEQYAQILNKYLS